MEFEPANLGSSDEYDNHGTTGVDVPDTTQSCQPQNNILKVKEMYIKSKKILLVFKAIADIFLKYCHVLWNRVLTMFKIIIV